MNLAVSRLRRLAQAPRPAPLTEERCDLCGASVPSEHRHMLDVQEQKLLCACRPCALLFDRPAAGGGHYRLIREDCRLVQDFALDDGVWEGLRIPVDMAFFFHSTPAERVVAFYPSPAGPMESLLELRTWNQLEEANPVLREMEPDVQALLVNRARGSRQHWMVPVDVCYRLVGLMRAHWKGFGGGEEVRTQMEGFFEQLWGDASIVHRDGSAFDHER